MTRINVLSPVHLLDQHLIAEYRELPRVFALARVAPSAPPYYTLGVGHMLFFYSRLGYLRRRHAALVAECRARGFVVNFPDPPAETDLQRVSGLSRDWEPTSADVRLNLTRLQERLGTRPDWYTLRGVTVDPRYYDNLERMNMEAL